MTDDFSEREIYYIQHYKTRNDRFGYNLENGGSTGSRGLVMSPEARKKISDSRKGTTHTQEQKDQIGVSTSKALLGKKPKRGNNSHVGVTINKHNSKKKWFAKITYLKKTYNLGSFYTEQEAIDAYESAYNKLINNTNKESEG